MAIDGPHPDVDVPHVVGDITRYRAWALPFRRNMKPAATLLLALCGGCSNSAAKTAAAKKDIQNIKVALEMYRVDYGFLPTTQQGLNALVQAPPGLKIWHGPYLPERSRQILGVTITSTELRGQAVPSTIWFHAVQMVWRAALMTSIECGTARGPITSHYEGPNVKRFISLNRAISSSFPATGGEVYEAGVWGESDMGTQLVSILAASPFSFPRICHKALRNLCLFATSLAFLTARCGMADPIQDFERDYPPAAAKLEEAYSHVRITTRQSRSEHSKPLWVQQVEMMREGSLLRDERIVVESFKPKLKVGSFLASSGDAKMDLVVTRSPGDKKLKILSYGPDDDIENESRLSCPAIYGSYCARQLRVSDYLKQKGVQIISVVTTKLNGRDTIEVRAEEMAAVPSTDKASLPSFVKMESHFILLRETWALSSWTVATADGTPLNMQQKYEGRLEYEKDTNPPRMKTAEYWLEVPGLGSKYSWRRDEVSKLEFGSLPASEFQPSALGVNAIPSKVNVVPATNLSKFDSYTNKKN